MATKLGSGYVDLTVRYSSAMGKITSDLTGLNKTAAKSGTAAGRAYSGSFSTAMGQGIGRSGIGRWFSNLQTEARQSGNTAGFLAGRAMGTAMTAALGVGLAGVTAMIGGIGYTLTKGFGRYRSLDATAKRLQAMGKSGDQVKAIMGDINDVVTGTPIALDAAASAATKFLQGGVKEGQPLKEVLTAIADAAGASGQNFGDLEIIFGQVMNKGKLQAEEMLQFNERNINIQAMLRKEFGWTADELTKLSKDGAITFDQLIQAVEGSVGGMAKRMGDTVDGAIGNLQTAVARLGANFLSAIFGDPLSTTEGPGGMATAINNLTTKLNNVNEWVLTHQGDIKRYFDDAMGAARGVANAIKDVGTFLAEHKELLVISGAAFLGWKAIGVIAGVVSDLKLISTLFSTTIPASVAATSGSVAGLAGVLGPVAVSLAAVLAARPFLEDWADSTPLHPVDAPPGFVTLNPFKWDLGAPNTGTPKGPIDTSGAPVLPGILQGNAGSSSAFPPGGDALDSGFLIPGSTPKPGTPLGDLFSGTGGVTPGGRPTPGTGLVSGQAITGSQVDSIAAQFGLTKTSGTRPGSRGYHGSGQAGDYSGPVDKMRQFAAYMSQTYGTALAEIIFDAPGWAGNVKNGRVTGPFGNVYTMDQAGYHGDHVHIAWAGFAGGGPVRGLGTATSDSIPAWLSNGEHVLTAKDVQAMGGQGAVYAFRDALHRNMGGAIHPLAFKHPDEPWRGRHEAPGSRGPEDLHPFPSNPEFGSKDQPGIRTAPDSLYPRGPWGNVLWHIPWWSMPGPKRFRPGSREALNRFGVKGFADGGAVTIQDLLLQLAQVDPNTTQHGQGQGAQPGPTPEELAATQGQVTRTEGYIPAGAGGSGQAGTSFASGLLQMGAQAINNVIDQAASAASTAAAAGLAAGTFGAGAPASPAAAAATQAAIGIGTQAAKRGVEYGFQMAGIGIDAVAEILSPFGVPRLFNTDVAAFIPQHALQPLGVTTGEKAELAQQQQHEGTGAPPGPGQMPGGPVQPGQLPGQQPPGPPAPPAQPGGVTPGPVPLPGVDQAAQAMPTAQPPQPPPSQPQPSVNPLEDMFTRLGITSARIYDNGGWLQPGGLAINASKRPEPMPVFSHDQWGTLDTLANQRVAEVDPTASGVFDNRLIIESITVKDVDELERTLNDRRRRQAKRYGSRPMGGL